ncbi:MAG TPA: hypothetical protein VHS05_18875 [Pyrinomonadaceae bacterium]|jgi:hypothetical protein|nr:hypothetical protein [Pyrinomonadaceae bacterium]
MPKVAAILVFFLVVSGCIYAQTHEVVSVRTARSDQPIKFDEFGQLGHCDVTARLDALAMQLDNQPTAKGAIVSYAPEGDGYGTGKRVLEMIKDYLVNSRGLAEDRIETIYGGRNSDKYHSQTELWIVPKGAPLPKTEKRETNVDTFQGLYYEGDVYDDFGVDIPAEMGPGIGGSIDASFADMLHQQKNSTGYIVVYSGEDLTPGAWRRVGQSNIDSFKEFNLEPSRFKLIFGGQQKESRLQYWILPNNAPPPVREAGEEKALANTVKVGDFSIYNLDEENNQKAIFSRLTEILTLDKTVRAFLVVTLNEPDPEEETTEQVASPVTSPSPETVEPVEEKPPVDLTKLVEKWRVDLANTHKIGPDRLIIVFTSEPYSGNLSLWIVPKGAPLPNPKEEEEPADPKDDPAVKP